MANFNWTFVDVDGVISVNAISASSYVSASTLYAHSITASNYYVENVHEINASGSTYFGESNDDVHIRTGSLVVASASSARSATGTALLSASISDTPGNSFIYASRLSIGGTQYSSKELAVTGEISSSLGISSLSLNTNDTVINTTHISSSLNISGGYFYGNGSRLTGVGTITTYTNASDNRILTSVDSSEINAEANLTFDGTDLKVAGNVSGSGALEVVGSGTVSGDLSVSGTVSVAGKIDHAGDPDTYINFTNDDINFQAGGVNFLDLTEDTQSEVTFNEGGVDVDFRVETADESHMLFIEGSSNRMSIGDNTGSPGATLEVKNHASAGAFGVPLVQLNSNDTDQQCLDINASNITANVVNVTANAVTTARVLAIGADGLTTGNALYVDDNSSNTGTRNTALIIQNHTGAIAATAFTVQSDGGVTGVKLDKNFSDTTAATVTGVDIDFDKTGVSTSNNTMYGLKVDMDNTTATDGANTMYGIYATPTLTHAADAGTPVVYGALINAQGGTNGTSLVQGARIEAGGGDINYGIQLDVEDGGVDLRIESSADSGDYFQIQTTTHGATTITTVDDDATAADLTFTIDGDIALNPAGGDVTVGGQLSASLGVTGSSLETATTVINSTHISSSLNISASEFYGNGAKLTGMSPITTYDNAADNRILTSVNASSINSEANLTFDGTDLSVISTTSARPRLYIQNENADEHPGQLIFNKTSSSPAEDDTIGRIAFTSYDAGENATVYGQIEGEIKKPNSGGERGRIKFSVAEYDGTLTEALTLQGDNSDGTVSVTVSNGTLYVPNGNIHLYDDRKIIFGNGSDAYLEYDEDGIDRLILSGSKAGGLEVSGAAVYLDGITVTSGTIAGAGSYLGVDSTGKMVLTASSGGGDGTPGGSDTQIQYNNGGAFGAIAAFTWDDTNINIADDTKLRFGSNADAHIEYDENGTDRLILSGAHGGFEVSGSSVYFDAVTVTSGAIAGAGSYLGIDGTGKIVLTASATGDGSVGGSDTQIQYNNGGAFGGVSTLTYNDSSGDLTVADDKKLFFGTNSDASIEYDEDGNDMLQISASAAGTSILSNNVYFKSDVASRPRLYIENQNPDANPGQLIFNKTSSSPADDDTIGRIAFTSYDAGENATVYAQIDGDIKKSTSGGERGRIKFSVSEYDGTVTEGLNIQGDNSDGTVSVTVANGTFFVPNGNIHLYDDRKIIFGNGSDASFEYDEDGTDTLLYAGASMRISDDVKLEFGSAGDAHLEYDEDGRDRLILSGAKGGFVMSGSAIYLDPITVASGTVAGAGSYLGIDTSGKIVLTASAAGSGGSTSPGGSDTQIQYNNGGSFGAIAAFTWDDTDLKIGDDTKLHFGNNSDAHIEYDEAGADILIISGSVSAGTVISGSNLVVDTTSGLTVKAATDDNPSLIIENSSDGIGGGQIMFKRTTTDEAANDIIGILNFMANDAAGNLTTYGQMVGQIDDPTSAGEEGRLVFKVAEYDGSVTEGFRIEGQASDGIIDCLVSNGSLQFKDLGGDGSTPASGYGGLYVNSDKIYFITDGGAKTDLTAGASTSGDNTFAGANTFSSQLTASAGIDLAGGLSYGTSVKTADFTAGDSECLFFCDLTGSVITGTLPAAATAGAGKVYTFKDVSGSASTYNLVISGSGVETIDGAAQVKITSNSGSVTCVSNGDNWFIIGTS